MSEITIDTTHVTSRAALIRVLVASGLKGRKHFARIVEICVEHGYAPPTPTAVYHAVHDKLTGPRPRVRNYRDLWEAYLVAYRRALRKGIGIHVTEAMRNIVIEAEELASRDDRKDQRTEYMAEAKRRSRAKAKAKKLAYKNRPKTRYKPPESTKDTQPHGQTQRATEGHAS